jgi:hypothetical protein
MNIRNVSAWAFRAHQTNSRRRGLPGLCHAWNPSDVKIHVPRMAAFLVRFRVCPISDQRNREGANP